MANLRLSHIYKVYDNGHKAVNDFNIDIKDKEFIVFVGPSGCGKSTTLRMIAGLEKITAGDLFIDDTLVNDMEPKDRDIAMVFQNYALYPHMTVFENMAFGLRNRNVPEDEIKRKVLEAAKILDIETYLDRKPKAMSGGQRQRVALGRAIVRDPKVFLLDEPLSNLDAKLRAQMRTEITKLHKNLATTFIYVTHDQIEAMTMGTRIVVMKLGYVQQIDNPMNLYNKPYNKFVAGFIGTPQMNFFTVTLNRVGDFVEVKFVDISDELAKAKAAEEEGVELAEVEETQEAEEIKYVEGVSIKLPFERVSKVHDSYLHGDQKVILGIRPEHIAISNKDTGLKCVVSTVEHLGNECIVYGTIGDQNKEFTMKDEGKNITVKTIEGTPIDAGSIINLEINPEKIHLFSKDTEITLMLPIPEYSRFAAKVDGENLELLGKKVALPPVFAKALGDAKELEVEIPPHAVVPGNDYELKVHEIEEVEGKHLAYLEYGDHYLFALVDENVKAGDKYKFSLLNEKLHLLVEGKEVLTPLEDKEALVGTFTKSEIKEGKERVLHFQYNIGGVKIEAPVTNGYKINAVEGNECYRRKYRYAFDRSKIEVVEDGIKAEVKEVLDYGNQKYAVLNVDDQQILMAVEKDFNLQQVNILVNGEDIEVWQIEIDMLIC